MHVSIGHLLDVRKTQSAVHYGYPWAKPVDQTTMAVAAANKALTVTPGQDVAW